MADDAGPPDEHADPTLELLIDLTRKGAVLAAFQATHDKFRGYHTEFLRLAASASSVDQDLAGLLRTPDAYAALFHEHHSAEDNYFFPALRRAAPLLDPIVDQLANQHIELAAQLAIVTALADLVRCDTDTDDCVARLVAELTRLQASVEEHLHFEETSTVPVVRSWRSWPV